MRWFTLYVATSMYYKKDTFLIHREVNLLLRVCKVPILYVLPVMVNKQGAARRNLDIQYTLFWLSIAVKQATAKLSD